MELVDTHCHIHEASPLSGDNFVHNKWTEAGISDPQSLVDEAINEGVSRLICVGTTFEDSNLAVNFVQQRSNCWASVGIHPHEAKDYTHEPAKLKVFAKLATKNKVIAVGECGLDYFYTHSSKADQRKILEFQLDLAQKHNLPLIFHVREAFEDFWPILDNFKAVRGVIHSFSAKTLELNQILSRELYVGLNGIMTFTKKEEQLIAAKAIPLDSLLLETDAPFLTPAPQRGTICRPKHVLHVAEFLAGLRGETMAEIANQTTQNACNLFGLK
ncbi:MAG: TatD family hydrolase [Patescibacteria group bacterium]